MPSPRELKPVLDSGTVLTSRRVSLADACPCPPRSPNLPTLTSVEAYPATVFLEATSAAEGRGTTTPFTMFGAPWLSAHALASQLNANGTEGASACFRAAWFTPVWFKYNGSDCQGVEWVRRVGGDFATGVRILQAVSAQAPPGCDGARVGVLSGGQWRADSLVPLLSQR